MVGDIVLAPLPFTDSSETKMRPVLVAADVGLEDWIVCEITSSSIPYARAIGISQDDLAAVQIVYASQVRPDRLFTLNESVFRRTVARLSDEKQAEIADAVRGLF